jgi:hypothetical protein
MNRRHVLAFAVTFAAGIAGAKPGAAQTPAPAPPTPSPYAAPLTPAEQAFYERASAALQRLYPNPAAAERAGWFRYNNEDRTGAISSINPAYANTPDLEHPYQLWFDVNGRLIGADFSQTVASFPEPTLFGLQKLRFRRVALHVHFVMKQPDGTTRYGLAVSAADFRAAGLDPLKPTADDLVKLGKVPSAAAVVQVFPIHENWDAQMWLIPNPAGQFVDANPNVRPSPTQGGGAGEQRV